MRTKTVNIPSKTVTKADKARVKVRKKGSPVGRKPKAKVAPLFCPVAVAEQLRLVLERDLTTHMCNRGMVAPDILASLPPLIMKKFVTADDKEAMASAAYERFKNTCDSLREINLPAADTRAARNSPSFLGKVLNTASKMIAYILGDVDMDQIFFASRHSSGSSIGVPFIDTSLEAKWTYPLSGTPRAIALFDKCYREYHPLLCEEIDRVWLGDSENRGDRYRITLASRADSVDKDNVKRRMIAVEPTLNMFFQQGLMTIMYDRLASVGLDVNSLQDEHRLRAWVSSITGREATIDFSDASDRVLYQLVKLLFPPKWFYWLDLVRTPSMELPSGEVIDLPMFSTMGNATTFPIELIIFWALAESTHLCRLHPTVRTPYLLYDWGNPKTCSVFGDDCIVPSDDAPLFMDICEQVGFSVNRAKSYTDPSPGFRESCGGDFFRGCNVRGLYLRAPESNKPSVLKAWLYSVINRAIEKYILYFGFDYVYYMDMLEPWFGLLTKGDFLRIVPPSYPEDSGLRDNGDLARILSCWFRPKHAGGRPRIRVSRHGVISFGYLRHTYPLSKGVNETVRFSEWLRRNHLRGAPPLIRAVSIGELPRRFLSQEHNLFAQLRQNGGYESATGLCPNWTPSF